VLPFLLNLFFFYSHESVRRLVALGAQAADQGHVEAWFHLGVLHLRGWGAPASATQALYFFSLAAKMGHLLAQYNLAMMHLSGAAAEKRAPPPPPPPPPRLPARGCGPCSLKAGMRQS